MKINEIAKLSGVTVRTLHYYDEIGLLKPEEITEAGYRIYNEKSLEILQQILFFRELDFSLKDIKNIMLDNNYDEKEALKNQRDLLIKKRDRLNKLIGLLNDSIKGGKKMSFKEFDKSEIEEAKNKYADEVKNRFGKTDAYTEYKEKSKNYNDATWNKLLNSSSDIFDEFSKKVGMPCDSEEVQKLLEKWQSFITENYYECTKPILSCLGLMYINDERFKNNINKHGEGTAEFMAKAIEVYCSK